MTARNAYSFKDGLTMLAAKDVGVDPYLAADAGEDARSVLAALRRAKVAKGRDKANHIAAAQAELRKLNPKRHGKLVASLQAKVLALQGRGGDTAVAHLEPGEMVIPRRVLTAELAQTIAAEAARRGIDPRQLIVGGDGASINPATGAEEFSGRVGFGGWVKEKMEPRIRQQLSDPDNYRNLSTAGRWLGLDLAADHLDQFINKSGDLDVPYERLIKYPTVQDSADRLKENFRTDAFVNPRADTADGQSEKDKLAIIKDGETVLFQQKYFDGVKRDERAESALRNPILGLDAELSLGAFGLGANGSFNVSRNANKLNVNGRLDYSIDDPYNFEPEKPYGSGPARMAAEGKAQDFKTKSQWSQDWKGTFDIDEYGRRSNSLVLYGQPYRR